MSPDMMYSAAGKVSYSFSFRLWFHTNTENMISATFTRWIHFFFKYSLSSSPFSSRLSIFIVPSNSGKQHRRVTISRWPGMLHSIGAQTPQGLPAVDYGVGREAEWSSERGQLDEERHANYTQVKYTCSRAQILKLTLKQAKVTKGVTVIHRRQEFSNACDDLYVYTRD